MVRRDSAPHPVAQPVDPETKAKLESANGLLQFDEVLHLADEARKAKKFTLKPSTLQRLHRVAIKGIYNCAGTYRTGGVEIQGTEHHPPNADQVAELVEQMCDYVTENWASATAIHLAAYVMWRLNWIHPFAGGNGRTSRAASYLVLCAKIGDRLAGTLTIPEQIIANRPAYYAALDKADEAELAGSHDVSAMEQLISSMLATQLKSIHDTATGVI